MLRFATLAALVGLGTAVAFAQDDTMLKVKLGDPFPDVALAAAQIDKVKKDAKTLSIADLKGKVTVIFFYPKALTKGCTIESCGFRDIIKDFPADVVVLGASGDDMALQQKFIDTHMLPYPLLCDTDLKLIKELGILGTSGKTPQRVTFVVGKDGKIAKIYNGKIDTAKHPKEVLEFVKALK